MENISMEEEPNHHAIDMYKVDTERLASMYDKISKDPKMLRKAAGKISCCIFRVPQVLKDANTEAYTPNVVSIGPYHRGHDCLNMIEEHKWRYLGSLLSRTKTNGLSLEDLLKAMASLESEARECYSETIPLDTHDFIEMMVLDGCFIIELFRKVAKLVPFEQDDPLVTMAWISPIFCKDFLRLENQIPFFVLQRLFELSKLPGEDETKTLSRIAMEFFNSTLSRPQEVLDQQSGLVGKHLLDLVRTSFIPSDLTTEAIDTPHPPFTELIVGAHSLAGPSSTQADSSISPAQRSTPESVPPDTPIWRPSAQIHLTSTEDPKPCLFPAHPLVTKQENKMVLASFIPSDPQIKPNNPTRMIHCVSKLQRAGIKITPGNSINDTFLHVKFKHGLIQMPQIKIDDFMTSFLLNCVAFEQCYRGLNFDHFTTYVSFLDCLINTQRDVEYLCDRKIIENYLGTEKEVASFITNAGIDVAVDLDSCYLSDLFKEVHKYYGNIWHVQWASFKYTYFDTPWSFISALAALVLLVLTAGQTFFAAYQYFDT